MAPGIKRPSVCVADLTPRTPQQLIHDKPKKSRKPGTKANNRQRHIRIGQPGTVSTVSVRARVPVSVLPIASCQREAFCLFQYISMNLSLEGIHRDETESSFLNGSRTVHIVSL